MNIFNSSNIDLAADELRKAADLLNKVQRGESIPNCFYGVAPGAAEFCTAEDIKAAYKQHIKSADSLLEL